ncbi:hypothetical protein LTR53_007115 [Teratosphaeriaceae sp. CCFEE 6253]|nr:hypothetical protein LTR53_007115 [Teratosphaeriaceae sp. CCFEE 6253]
MADNSSTDVKEDLRDVTDPGGADAHSSSQAAGTVQAVGTFLYEKLPPSSQGRFIRLVEVLSDLSETGRLQCLLHEVAFDESIVKYETLSYSWGTAAEKRTIACNGQTLEITGTLHYALLTLKHPDTSRLIWIDQICINQHDNKEKTGQVAMMRDIYARSSLTIAWLGEANAETNVALKAAHRIALAGTSSAFAEAMRGRFNGNASDQLRKLLVERKGGWGKAEPTQSEHAAISVLLHRPWFTRMWVIQEVGVSDRVLVRCGDASLDFDELMWAVAIALTARAERNSSASLGAFAQLKFLGGIRQAKRADQRFSLIKLLEAAQMFASTDPRDKFYALYGLTTSDLPSMGIVADYSAPADWVYMHTVVRLVQESGDLRLLELVDKPSEQLPNLRSWVPSLSTSWPYLNPLADGSAGWDDFIVGRKMRRQLVRVAYESRELDMAGLDEREREAAIEKTTDEVSSDEDEVAAAPVLAASQGSSLATFELEGSGALRLSGQLIDKVNQTSDILQAQIFDAGSYATAINEVDSVRGAVTAFSDVTRSLYRRVIKYTEALVGRDEMVMARAHVAYPTGEPVLTAYRKTLTAGSLTLEDGEAEQTFDEWRRIMKPASRMPKLGSSKAAARASGVLKLAGIVIGGQTVTRQTRVFFAMTEVSYGRRLSWTQKGYLGLMPGGAMPGDLVVLLRGGRLPFVIRPVEGGHREY